MKNSRPTSKRTASAKIPARSQRSSNTSTKTKKVNASRKQNPKYSYNTCASSRRQRLRWKWSKPRCAFTLPFLARLQSPFLASTARNWSIASPRSTMMIRSRRVTMFYSCIWLRNSEPSFKLTMLSREGRHCKIYHEDRSTFSGSSIDSLCFRKMTEYRFWELIPFLIIQNWSICLKRGAWRSRTKTFNRYRKLRHK